MRILLLAALICLLSADQDPLQLSGRFNTIYLASNDLTKIEKYGNERVLFRDVNFSKNYKQLSMTYYIRKKKKCQKHTLKAFKSIDENCGILFVNYLTKDCEKTDIKNSINGWWWLDDPKLYFPDLGTYRYFSGSRVTTSSTFTFQIAYVSNTTMLFFVKYINVKQREVRLTAALSKETNLTEKMREEYVNLTKTLEIPIENIKNIYKTDRCPK